MKFSIIFLFSFLATSTQIFKYETDKEISINVGEIFQISLDSNPTTGYRWEIVNVLKKLTIPSDEPNGDFIRGPRKIVGSRGKQIFTFEAIAPGKEEIKFAYKRSWESTSETLGTIFVSIK